jgi:acetyl-CoA C-acetyltransferase
MQDNDPIIVGVAQRTFRDADAGRSPLDALAEVAGAALGDAGPAALARRIDDVAAVPFLAREVAHLRDLYPTDVASALAGRLGLEARAFTTHYGGNTPQQFVNLFADRLARGECRAVLMAGAELFATLFAALRAGSDISAWADKGEVADTLLEEYREPSTEAERAHGFFEPINAYPMVEIALRHRYGLAREAHRQRLGELVSRMSRVAASNPLAWRREALSPEQVLDPGHGNHVIVHPYTKVMNAILAVDMAAAVVMTTVREARELGIPREQWVFLRGCAAASDVWCFSERIDFHQSPALRAAAAAALAMSGLTLDEIDLFDLYSCFPSAVQVACDALGMAWDDPRGVTVTGGLTLFGGPGNNYSLHAIAEMASQLRAGTGAHGVVTANGGYLTKHAVGVYSTQAPSRAWPVAGRDDLQPALDAMAHPLVDPQPAGDGVIEACTVAFDREGPARGFVLGRLADGRRFMANTPVDAALLRRLTVEDPVGLRGRVSPGNPTNLFEL